MRGGNPIPSLSLKPTCDLRALVPPRRGRPRFFEVNHERSIRSMAGRGSEGQNRPDRRASFSHPAGQPDRTRREATGESALLRDEHGTLGGPPMTGWELCRLFDGKWSVRADG